ncbi:epoxide hydrolase [Kibdelosporangium aridum]|uniref:Epoxide hydrolase n=1 Tax=Kibdelosporangium aridum TaxID=2030 RepID=A0A428ZE71_KIBAR|nr:epoxide hydrolase family protein [Kibdelosporangium aridum]RSM86346.1 epoxide hydrolase [Kibdelosporangium aridum]
MEQFRIDVPQSDLDDLHARLAAARWPDDSPEAGWDRGVPLGHLRELAEYWRTGFDWRAQEAALNELPQFVTQIDDQRVHFLHVRSANPDAIPLLITHGWPGSFAEFTKIIGPLTDPVAPVSFHVVVPSIPGFGFSTPVAQSGWGLMRVAGTFAQLMTLLGYERFAAQGGDAGAGITSMLGMMAPHRVIGTHLNGPSLPATGTPPQIEGLSDRDKIRLERHAKFLQDGDGYIRIQATRPQTLAYALTDSPVGQLAWIVEKFHEWTDPNDLVDRDHLLTNISLYWFTRSGATSAHFLYEGMREWASMAGHDVSGWEAPPAPPQAVAVFAADNSIRAVIDPDGKVDRWTEYEHGGHFAAMEVPDLLVDDIRAFFAPLV